MFVLPIAKFCMPRHAFKIISNALEMRAAHCAFNTRFYFIVSFVFVFVFVFLSFCFFIDIYGKLANV